MCGPFQGMVYLGDSVGSLAIPKMIGFYEKELHWVIESIVNRPYDVVVDIGAAEGYYAIGLALRLSASTIIAYELEGRGRHLIEQAARSNGVPDRVEAKGRCNIEDLSSSLRNDRSLVFCDCEGDERALLDPEEVPGLKYADILVELHDFIVPGMCEQLRSRFSSSQELFIIDAVDRKKKSFPGSQFLSKSDRLAALDEGRPKGMQWLWMQTNRGSE